MKNKTIRVYGLSGTKCKFCVKVKDLLLENDIGFEYIEVDKDPKSLNLIKETYHLGTVPQVFADNELIGGYDKTFEYLKKTLPSTDTNTMSFVSLHPDFELPEYKTDGSGGFDLVLTEDVFVKPDTSVIIDLGFAAEVPVGFEAILLPRSGVGFNDHLQVTNTVGLIDNDFRKEWKASLSLKSTTIHKEGKLYKKGQRILQATIIPYLKVSPVLVDSIESTGRIGGIGSTGE